MIDEPKDAQASSESSDQNQDQSTTKPNPKKKSTSKRIAKKAAAKKTTKKSTTKKTTKKAPATKAGAADVDASAQSDSGDNADDKAQTKTTKKPAAKKTTKKVAKKKTAKRTSKKDLAEADQAPQDPDVESETEADTNAESDNTDEAKPKRTRRRSSRRSASAENDESNAPQESDEPKRSRSRSSSKSASTKSSSTKTKPDAPRPRTEMIVNYVPGEDCRIAILEDGQLEDVFSEHTNKVSRVNNIYVGRVTNVEASIQAAFIDFGTEFNGFLHISDIHPQYFAKGDDKTERVGKKTPHRERPPIQDCLKKGQEIIVQVLKEGVGTKGPSLTSYLSIPGRFLVMMPGMDKVGVSRKEEDDDKRKAAKAILNTLDLPEGFGFILRTAGFDRNKTELKRDLAYLSRLWADMEKRRKGGKKPRLLYTESDLLVRTVRDLLSSEIDRVVIDSEAALKRVARFVKIAAPRSGAKLAHYTGTAPIFHAYDIERQIEEIHAREVALPSGGRLVIDQTEALVAIDVNSGRSRGAKDAESNAYQTNLEAVDAICRQLRLRDLGGLVVNDLIDMRYISHRKDIENRFRERLKRDRAKTSVAQISEFGLLEMTRQRMRGSMESQHFADCPICRGRGLIQRPGSVADSALRDLASLIDHDKVHRAELVVHSRVASELLSTRRSSLIRVELSAGKVVDVRVSDSLPMDRFSLYAYEANGNDIDVEKLATKSKPKPQVVDWINTDNDDDNWAIDLKEESDESTVLKLAEDFAKKAEQVEKADLPIDDSKPLEIKPDSKSRSRSKLKPKPTQKNESQDQQDHEPELDENGEPIKKKRRRRRRGRGRSGADASTDTNSESNNEQQSESSNDRNGSADSNQESNQETTQETNQETNEDGTPRKKRRRRRGRGRSGSDGDSKPQDGDSSSKPDQKQERKSDSKPEPVAEPKPRRRGLYSGGRRKLTSAEVAAIDRDI